MRQPQIDQTFEVRGVGSVVAGTVGGGGIAVGQRLLLGPNAEAGFNPVIVTCIQRSSVRLDLAGHRDNCYMQDCSCHVKCSCRRYLVLTAGRPKYKGVRWTQHLQWPLPCAVELTLLVVMPLCRASQVPVGSIRKGQSATLAIHPVSALQAAAAEGIAMRAHSDGLIERLPESNAERTAAAAESQGASASQQNGDSGRQEQAPSRDPHQLPDTALRIQRVSFSPAGEAFPLADPESSSEIPAIHNQPAQLQSLLGSEVRASASSFNGFEGRSAASGEQHRAAMPEGTLGVAAADLDGLAAKSQVRTMSIPVRLSMPRHV